jgi:hypothetical protein
MSNRIFLVAQRRRHRYNFTGGPVLYSQVDGTVVQSTAAILAIQANSGNVIYLLHGTPSVGVNAAVHVGDSDYTVGNLSNGCVRCDPA